MGNIQISVVEGGKRRIKSLYKNATEKFLYGVRDKMLELSQANPDEAVDTLDSVVNNKNIAEYSEQYSHFMKKIPEVYNLHTLFCEGVVHCCDGLPKEDVVDFAKTLANGKATEHLVDAWDTSQRNSALNALSNVIEFADAEQKIAFFEALSENDFLCDLFDGALSSDVACFLYTVFKDVPSEDVETTLMRSSALTSIRFDDDFKNMVSLQYTNMLASNEDLPELFCKYAQRDRLTYEGHKDYGFDCVYNPPAQG